MKFSLLIGSCLVFSLVNGQSKKFSFKLGEEYELPRKTEDLAFFGNDQDGIVNLSLKKEELNIIRFDAQRLSHTSEKTIELAKASKNFNSEEVVTMGNNYFWLHSDWEKDAEKNILYYDKIDVASGKLTEINHKLIETTRLGGESATMTGFYRYKLTGKYKFNYDAAAKKLLVSYRFQPEERNDKKNYDKIGLQVFDENMHKIWGGEFTMPYTEAIMDNSDFSVDASGNAYLLAKIYDTDARKEKDKATGKPAYHFEVFKFSKGSKQVIHPSVSIDDYYIKQPTLIENTLHDMVIACTYSKKSSTNGTDGIFLAIMDQNGKVIKYKNGYYEFPIAELTKFESGRKKRRMENKDDYENPDLSVRDVLVESDGSVFVACEEYHSETQSHMDSRGNWTYSTMYYYDDILGAKISSSGQFEWLRKVPKRQKGNMGRDAMSFKLISDASGYYFLFLDNKKNMELAEDETPKYHIDGRGGQVVVAKLDNKGVLNKEIVFDTREEDVKIYPADFSRINGNQFVGRARVKRNLYQPLLITVN
ncbi:MAG: hypothetical protein ABIQ88_17270 [Chitinophagaceae bacterium]